MTKLSVVDDMEGSRAEDVLEDVDEVARSWDDIVATCDAAEAAAGAGDDPKSLDVLQEPSKAP